MRKFLGYGLIAFAGVLAVSGATVLVLNAVYDIPETAAPGNPASGFERYYADSTAHQLKCLTSSGGSCLPSGGGGSGQGWPFTFTAPPACGSLTQVNFSPSPATTSCTSATGYLTLMQTTGTNNGDVTAVTTNVIAATFTFTVGINTQIAQSGGYTEWGIVVYDGTKVIEFGVQIQAANAPTLVISQFNTVSSFNTSPITRSTSSLNYSPVLWLQIQEDATHRTYRMSADGINFFQVYQEALNTFLTTTQYGMDVRNTQNGNQITQAEALSWKGTNP